VDTVRVLLAAHPLPSYLNNWALNAHKAGIKIRLKPRDLDQEW
jgi:hypothetical protein